MDSKFIYSGKYDNYIKIILPYHFFDDERIIGPYDYYELETGYKINCNKKEFIEFYNSLNKFNIEISKDGFMLTSYLKKQYADFNDIKFPIRFVFEKGTDVNYVSLWNNGEYY